MATDATLAEIETQIEKWAEKRRAHLKRVAVLKIITFLSFGLALGHIAGGDTGFWFWAFLVTSLAAMVLGMFHEADARELERKINGG